MNEGYLVALLASFVRCGRIQLKNLAKEDLEARNADYKVQQQIIRDQFLTEQAKKPPLKHLKRIPKPEEVVYEWNESAKGRSIGIGS